VRNLITFDRGCAEQILRTLEMSVDRGGFICDRNGQQMLDCFFGKPVTLEEFGGVKRGKTGGVDIFCNDIASLIQFADSMPGGSCNGDGPKKIGGTDAE
jgi:hypothetical protein